VNKKEENAFKCRLSSIEFKQDALEISSCDSAKALVIRNIEKRLTIKSRFEHNARMKEIQLIEQMIAQEFINDL
jgi:hypothetical protein